MALDPIWKQQLTLVTYGNEFLNQGLSFQRWLNHHIFDQHSFHFRDLLSQHLLAQHFQIWLEGLKKQGVQRLSLHSSSLLNDEQNPNANVELLPFAHFIVSHEKNKKQAWIFGKELAEWYNAENDYDAPASQQLQIRRETFWRYELNHKLIKRIEADMQLPRWDDIHNFTEAELFLQKPAEGFIEPEVLGTPYYGTQPDPSSESNESTKLALLPTDAQADFAHDSLHRLDALNRHIQSKIQHPYHADGSIYTPEEQLNLRHFAQKTEDLTAKFIVKVANHYKTARLTPVVESSPLDGFKTEQRKSNPQHAHTPNPTNKPGAGGVITLIIITVVIGLLAYYFGL
ncbi:hypothetical protein [Acinetobacter sp. CFCC 11171]|uniref:hypothetical protein n=1 Tax=Acinetobacter sp. CFCC 11171 TaxID=1775558 RepID=UPI000DD0A710|nr:hypothetical protein [Acinetobacter sp. CFCC 11171]